MGPGICILTSHPPCTLHRPGVNAEEAEPRRDGAVTARGLVSRGDAGEGFRAPEERGTASFEAGALQDLLSDGPCFLCEVQGEM